MFQCGERLMSCCNNPLLPGDSVFHPKYGFGTIHGLTRRDRIHPIHEPKSAETESDGTEEYYDIHLGEGGTLLVPVSRAESVGLRCLTDGIEAVKAGLCSPAQSLPDKFRERAAVLRMREQLAEPSALAHTVRDMLAQSRGRTLSAGEKTWLDKSCQRLSTEAAMVDHISMFEARAAIWKVVRELSATSAIP
jgi:RNA polymerase-interacting CarD/CdnL/TRCF family regulator